MKEKDLIKKLAKKSFKKKLKKAKNDLSLFNNRYYLNEELGRGGLSIVYNSSDVYCDYFNEESNIAIKVPNEKLLEKDDISAFVYSEYSFLKKLNHKNIVKVLDFGIDNKSNIPYIVLEKLKGSLLSDLNILDMSKKFKNMLFKDLLSSIEYIHLNNIIHADITPSNIMIKDNNITLFDFGISQDINKNKNFTLEYKKVKAFNPKYCAPEVLEGSKPNTQSDIFSFACLMYEIYAAKSLFEKNSLELKNKTINTYDFTNIPRLLRTWFKSSLSLNPQNRIYKNTFSRLI
jgi:serine/threonine protein kinase